MHRLYRSFWVCQLGQKTRGSHQHPRRSPVITEATIRVLSVNAPSYVDEYKYEYKYESLEVSSPKPYVLHVAFDKPEKLNSMTVAMWAEITHCFEKAANDQNVRSIVLSGKGKMFTSGLDFAEATKFLSPQKDKDVARRAFELNKMIGSAQAPATALEKCMKPVITAVHNACIGGGVDMAIASDIRLCTEDAFFKVQEVDNAIAPDMGTLQRFSKVIGCDSLVRELCYTARKLSSADAMRYGLVSKVLKDRDELIQHAIALAETIASKSPVAIQGTKHNLVYSRDHSVEDSLQYMRVWSASMMQTVDIIKSVQALVARKTTADVDYEDI